MNPSSTATTPERYIAQLDQPRREHIGRLHDLIRTSGYLALVCRDRLPRADIAMVCVRLRRLDDLDQDLLRELVREAAKSPAASAT